MVMGPRFRDRLILRCGRRPVQPSVGTRRQVDNIRVGGQDCRVAIVWWIAARVQPMRVCRGPRCG